VVRVSWVERASARAARRQSLGQGRHARVAWTLPTPDIHRFSTYPLDLTDAKLDSTDKTGVILWTLPTNLIAESNNLSNSPVSKVQASLVHDSWDRMTLWGKFTR
jgi:hypothetical protein